MGQERGLSSCQPRVEGLRPVSPGREAQPAAGVPGLLEARAPSFSRPLEGGEAGP